MRGGRGKGIPVGQGPHEPFTFPHPLGLSAHRRGCPRMTTGQVLGNQQVLCMPHTFTWGHCTDALGPVTRVCLGKSQFQTFSAVSALTNPTSQSSAYVQIGAEADVCRYYPQAPRTGHSSSAGAPEALAVASEAGSHITDLHVCFLVCKWGFLTSLSHRTHVIAVGSSGICVKFKELHKVGTLMLREGYVYNKNGYNLPFWIILENEVDNLMPPVIAECWGVTVLL